MKIKKKTAMLVSFTLGSLIFATTALADIANKSGYDQLKDTLKITADSASNKLDSFTLDFSSVIKDNDKILTSDNEVQKHDRSKKAEEYLSTRESIEAGKFNSTTYSDPTTMIQQNDKDLTYYVTEFTEPRKIETFNNPFDENQASDVEKIADAVVGSLKDQVMVKENQDGTKDFSGSLSEVQIPTLVNAVASYQLKQQFNGRNQGMPHLTQDIYVKDVKGSAHVNKEGLLENMLGTVNISGKDEQGNVHEITLEILFKLSGINSTVVTKPDLNGQKVIKNITKTQTDRPQITNPAKFIGKFKNDIIIEKDGKFVKTGERILEITQMNQSHVSGKYYEEYKPSYEQDAQNKRDYSFEANFNSDKTQDPLGAHFEITGENGTKIQGDIHFDDHYGKVYLNLNRYSGNQNYDGTFSPDFE